MSSPCDTLHRNKVLWSDSPTRYLLIFDIVITHNGDEPLKERNSLLWDTFSLSTETHSVLEIYTPCPKKIVPFFYFFFLGDQCVESGVSCTDCY